MSRSRGPFYPTRLRAGHPSEKRVDPWTIWERCEGGEGEEALRRLGRDDRRFFADSTLLRSRWSRLPFYAAHRLMELQFARDRRVGRAFVLHGPERTWWLNGESNPIHDVNDAESLALTQPTVGDYIRFFFYFLRADRGAFVLIESAEEVGPRAEADGADEDQDEMLTLQVARGRARPLQPRGLDAAGQVLVDVTVAYDGSLFDASLAVGTGGTVEMTGDDPIGALGGLTVPEAPFLELEGLLISWTPVQDEPPFDDRAVGEYLHGRLGAGYPAGLDVEAVGWLTCGVPLAVSLIGELLGAGLDPAVALAPVRAASVSGVVSELARRYLAHAPAISALQLDRPLLYGLALLDGEARAGSRSPPPGPAGPGGAGHAVGRAGRRGRRPPGRPGWTT